MHGEVQGPVGESQREVLEMVHRSYDMTRHTRSGSQQTAALTDEFVDDYAIVGPPSLVVQRLHEVAALGVGKVIVVGASPGSDRQEAAVAAAAMGDVLAAM
jgi:hypothetical protein